MAFEILGDPLEHQTYLGTVDWNVFGLSFAGLFQVDRHELAALQPFQPIDAFAQQGCRGGHWTTLKALDFIGGNNAQPLIAAVGVLRQLNATGARRVPEGAPTEFVPARWRGYLEQAARTDNAVEYRHYWELTVLLALRDGLRSGDVFVPGSRRYADPSAYLLKPQAWAGLRLEFCELVGKSTDAGAELAKADAELRTALTDLERVLAMGVGPGRLGEDGELIIPPLSAEDIPAEAEVLKAELTELLPFARSDGEPVERTDWFRVRTMGSKAEYVQRFTQGQRVLVIGRLEIGEWQTREGETRTSYDIWADDVVNLSPREEGGAPRPPAGGCSDAPAQTGVGREDGPRGQTEPSANSASTERPVQSVGAGTRRASTEDTTDLEDLPF